MASSSPEMRRHDDPLGFPTEYQSEDGMTISHVNLFGKPSREVKLEEPTPNHKEVIRSILEAAETD